MNCMAAHTFRVRYPVWALVLLVAMAGGLVLGIAPVYAQDEVADVGERIQRLTGYTGVGDSVFYRLPHLRQGETLYVYVTGLSGNLDPFAGLFNGTVSGADFYHDFHFILSGQFQQLPDVDFLQFAPDKHQLGFKFRRADGKLRQFVVPLA